MDRLLARSAKFEQKMIDILRQKPSNKSDKIRLSEIMSSVSFEHGESFKILLAARNFTSAIGILRLQFESFVRGVWVCYVAKDSIIDKLTAELNDKNVKRADNSTPMLSKMIKELESKAPKEVIEPILEFKEYSWKPLNSYVHGGLHAIDRHSKGYPTPILEQALKASNGICGMTGIFTSVLAGDQSQFQKIAKLFDEFSECLQMKNELT